MSSIQILTVDKRSGLIRLASGSQGNGGVKISKLGAALGTNWKSALRSVKFTGAVLAIKVR